MLGGSHFPVAQIQPGVEINTIAAGCSGIAPGYSSDISSQLCEVPRIVRIVQRTSMQEILSFKRSGAASAVPLQFLTEGAHGYRSEYRCQSEHLLA